MSVFSISYQYKSTELIIECINMVINLILRKKNTLSS